MNLNFVLSIVVCCLYDYTIGFNCPNGQDGMYTNVNDPHSFWHCSNDYAYLKQCPQPLLWSQQQQICDWKVADASTTSQLSTVTSTTTTTEPSTTTSTITTSTTIPLTKCPRLITFDNIPGASRFPQPLPNGFSGFQWVNTNYMNVSHHEQMNGWSGYSAALSSGQYVGLNKDGQILAMIINAAKSFTLKSFVVASAWNGNLILEITGKRGGSVFKSKQLTLKTQPQWVELNWSQLETVNFVAYDGTLNSKNKGRETQFAIDNLCVEFSK